MNRRLSIIVLSILVGGCNGSEDRTAYVSPDLLVKLVDQNQRAFKVRSIQWWYANQADKKYSLTCASKLCAEWLVKASVTASVVLHAEASIERKEDKTCWDLYDGEIRVRRKMRRTTIVMTHSSTACLSQTDIQGMNGAKLSQNSRHPMLETAR